MLGALSPYGNTSVMTSGNGTLSCSTVLPATFYACVSIGTGTGGTTPTNRTLASGGHTIAIQVNSGGSSSQIGNGISYPMYGPISFSLGVLGSINEPFPLGVTVPPPSPAPAPGAYSTTFTGSDATIIFSTVGNGSSTCSSLSAGPHSTLSFNFPVTATVPTQCTVSASTMAFPTTSILASQVTAASTIAVTCNASTSVTIGLDNGGSGTGPTARKMKSGANAITYGIYQDAAYSQPWGNSTGTNTVSLGSGTGSLTAYGRVPAQISPSPGSYSDIVNVTITY